MVSIFELKCHKLKKFQTHFIKALCFPNYTLETNQKCLQHKIGKSRDLKGGNSRSNPIPETLERQHTYRRSMHKSPLK
jgi:hypothetical protein